MKKIYSTFAGLLMSVFALNTYAVNPLSLVRIAENTAAHLNLPVATVEQQILKDFVAVTGKQSPSSLAALQKSLPVAELEAALLKMKKLPNASAITANFNLEATAAIAERNTLGNADGAAGAGSLKASNEIVTASSKEEILKGFEKNALSTDPRVAEFAGQTVADALTTADVGIVTIGPKTCSQAKGLSYTAALNLHTMNHGVANAISKVTTQLKKLGASASRIRECGLEAGSLAIYKMGKAVLFKGENVAMNEITSVITKVQGACAWPQETGLLVPALSRTSMQQIEGQGQVCGVNL